VQAPSKDCLGSFWHSGISTCFECAGLFGSPARCAAQSVTDHQALCLASLSSEHSSA